MFALLLLVLDVCTSRLEYVQYIVCMASHFTIYYAKEISIRYLILKIRYLIYSIKYVK